MSEKVTYKRTSRVSFLGVSNLRHDRALKLRDVLQNIITQLSEIHASCDDAKIKVDERHKKIKSLGDLEMDVNTLVVIAQEQVAVCDENNQIKKELRSICEDIVSHVNRLRSELHRFSTDSRGAYTIVDLLLQVVKLTVDLLRAADRYTVHRVAQQTEEVQKLADAVANATSMSQLVEKATPLSRAAIEVARVAEQRAHALEENSAAASVKETLHRASQSVGEYTPQVILASKEAIGSGNKVNMGPLYSLKHALNDIAHATRISPEFAVIFDVDYLDTELGLKLAALADTVRSGDRIGTAKNLKAVDKELERRIAIAKKDPQLEPAIQAARAANQAAQNAAREALNTRIAQPDPQSGTYLLADKNMTNSFSTLKQTAAALPDANVARTNSQVPLIQAARNLSLQLWGLLQEPH
eukprot:Phypoly_transcript_09735.p1 GENE.Phypoly_transcript_09735~~Phypoly_transcript_09735.p1  ORF type:complete len:413 (+),score=72.47 Phypoly_transcript_09735:72-1310(+)